MDGGEWGFMIRIFVPLDCCKAAIKMVAKAYPDLDDDEILSLMAGWINDSGIVMI